MRIATAPVCTFLFPAFASLLLCQTVIAQDVDFNRDVRPILSAKCFQCHGPDENAREADLRLDLSSESEGPFASAVIVPGEPSDSELLNRIRSTDADSMMPPPDSHLDPLDEREQAILEQWILAGAGYDQFWAFVAPQKQTPPVDRLTDPKWTANRIDSFVGAELSSQQRKPADRADERTLIRRLYLDTIGLPPSPAEIQAFLDDDHPDAWEREVDRLLNSPRYGEHMARYWLDLVRFADTNGIHHDHYREMTPYRDWVIHAFNDNLPYDQFVREQLAGDLLPEPTSDQLIASGFNRLHLIIDRGTAIPEESFHRNVVDRVSAFGTAFLGLTVGCAACHDHKYDPISQRDFYQLYAFFNNIDATPETPGRNTHPPFLRLPDEDQEVRLAELAQRIQVARQKKVALETELKELEELSTPKAGEDKAGEVKAAAAERRERKQELEAKFAAAEKAVNEAVKVQRQFEDTLPVSLIMKERAEVRPTHIRLRGVYDQLGEVVERDTPAFLPPLESSSGTKTRLDLANWLTSPDHPLLARVTVNRFWQQFFGVGLVKTSEDFGTQGEWPSHSALLDDLAMEFQSQGWDVKRLVRDILTSETYRQASRATPAEYQRDPENRQLARGARFRLDAEVIRDQALSLSGMLNEQMFGRSVKPPQPPDLWKTVSMVSSSTYAFKADEGEKIYRRSLYSFWKRALPPPQMTIFDAPTRESCIARRERTNTPLQALVLMNEQQYFAAARQLALQVEGMEGPETEQIQWLFEKCTGQLPDAEELEALEKSYARLREMYAAEKELAKQLVEPVLRDIDAERAAKVAAWTMLSNAMLNLDIVKTRN